MTPLNFKRCLNIVSLLLLTTPATLTATPPDPTAGQRSVRIIGGQPAEPGDWPWIVSINLSSDNSVRCAGSLIHPNWVLTAAHCLDDKDNGIVKKEDLFVVVGLYKQSNIGTEGEKIEIKQVLQHPDWHNADSYNWPDIGLLELATPSKQPPLTLITQDSPATAPGQLATVMGWGKTSLEFANKGSDVLQEVELPIVSDEVCKQAYIDEEPILKTMVCAGLKEGGKDTCLGDSGAPLVVWEDSQWKQLGIASYGGKQDGPDCAGPDAYGVYNRVSAFMDVINQYVTISTTPTTPPTTPPTTTPPPTTPPTSHPSFTGAVDYDGIWQSEATPNTFFMLRRFGYALTVVLLHDNGQSWHPLVGAVGPAKTIISSASISPIEMTAEFQPQSSKEAILTITACTPKSDQPQAKCPWTVGTQMELKKTF